jgi:argininosuccinate synthase
MERIVLAYSGGLDTLVAIPWLKEHRHAEIVAVTMDLGQGQALEAVRDKALAIGAVRAHVLDLREEFTRDFVLPALQADALYDDRSPMTAALARPLIARKLVEIARIEQAQAIAHGGGGSGRRIAFDVLIKAINPRLKVITPAREWRMARADVIEYARSRGISLSPAIESPYRVESNLWGRSIECAVLEDEPSDDVYVLTRPARECPDEPAYVDIAFERGVPSAINGVSMPVVELIASLTTIGSVHGVGRIDMVEHRIESSRVRELGEAPAAVLLHAAHRELRRTLAPRELQKFSRVVSAEYADAIYNGLWFSPLRDALDAFVGSVQKRLTGVVRLKLFKGAYTIVSRTTTRPPTPAIVHVAKGT